MPFTEQQPLCLNLNYINILPNIHSIPKSTYFSYGSLWEKQDPRTINTLNTFEFKNFKSRDRKEKGEVEY